MAFQMTARQVHLIERLLLLEEESVAESIAHAQRTGDNNNARCWLATRDEIRKTMSAFEDIISDLQQSGRVEATRELFRDND